MAEPTPWMIISVFSIVALLGTYAVNEVNWRGDADRVFCNNYILKSIGDFDSLSMKSRTNLVGASDILNANITEEELVPHLRKYGFRQPKGGCGWIKEPIRKDLSDFDTCYLNEVSVKNCKFFYMVAAKFGDAKEATKLIGSHFQIMPCSSNISEEKLCSK